MTKSTMAWALALGIFLPRSAQAQQDPALIGQGAQLYSANCGRCHNARSSTERTDADWAVIVRHMRARANLTKTQAEAVIAYLQATNLPEGTPSAGGNDTAQEGRAPSTDVVVPLSLQAAALAKIAARAEASRAEASRADGREAPGGN